MNKIYPPTGSTNLYHWSYGELENGNYYVPSIVGAYSTAFGMVANNLFKFANVGKLYPQYFRATVNFLDQPYATFLGLIFGEYDEATSVYTPKQFSNGSYVIDVSTSLPIASSFRIFQPYPNDIYVDIDSTSKTYVYGLLFNRSGSTSSNVPGCRGVSSDYSWKETFTIQHSTSGNNSSVYESALVAEKKQYCANFQLRFKFDKRHLTTIYPTTTHTFLIPHRIDDGKKTWCKFNNVNCATSQFVQAELFQLHSTGHTSTTIKDTLRIDFGSTDYIQIAGNQVALNAVTPEVSNNIDIALAFSTTDVNLFYMNKSIGQGGESTGDIATFSHAAKNTGSRSTHYALSSTGPFGFNVSRNGSVDSIEIGAEMFVIWGDSQATLTSTNDLGYHIKRQFSAICWDAAIPGNSITRTSTGNHTAGYLRYKSTTPGNGDLCDMRDMVFIDAGFGLNDIARINSSGEAFRDYVVGDIGYRLIEVFADVKANGNQGMLIGLPPYSSTANTSYQEAYAIKEQLNPLKNGIALGLRCAFADPYNDVVDITTFGSTTNPFERFKDTSDSGTHYNSTGASKAVRKLKINSDSGYINGIGRSGSNNISIGL